MRRTRRWIVGLVALALAGLVAGPAQAAEVLTVEGRANRSIDWRPEVPATLSLWAAQVVGGSELFGLVIEDVNEDRVKAMVFDVPRLGFAGESVNLADPTAPAAPNSPPPVVFTRDELQLPPGRYRLRLIGDQRGAVSIPVTTGAGADLRAAVPAPAAAITWGSPERLPSPAGATILDELPFDVVARGVVAYIAQEVTSDAHLVTGYASCLRLPGELCATRTADPSAPPLPGGYAHGVNWQPITGDGWVRHVATWSEDGLALAPGPHVAETTWASAAVSSRMDTLVISVGPSGD